MVNKEATLLSRNHYIIPLDCVMFLQLSEKDVRVSSEQKNNSLVTSCCLLTDNEIETFLSNQYLSL